MQKDLAFWRAGFYKSGRCILDADYLQERVQTPGLLNKTRVGEY